MAESELTPDRRALRRSPAATHDTQRPDPAEARLAQLRSGGPGPLEEIARRLIADRPDIASALGLPGVIAGLDTATAEEPRRG